MTIDASREMRAFARSLAFISARVYVYSLPRNYSSSRACFIRVFVHARAHRARRAPDRSKG